MDSMIFLKLMFHPIDYTIATRHHYVQQLIHVLKNQYNNDYMYSYYS